MLFLLVASMFVSLVCYSWGAIIFNRIKSLSESKEAMLLHWSITCLLGLSSIIALAGISSLFVPLGAWYIRLLLFLPALSKVIKTGKKIRLTPLFKEHHPLVVFLFLCLLLLFMVMGSWTISHPDTLAYHVQTIEWIKDYKVIPGLAHLNLRLGLQGLWFPVCALFDFVVDGKHTFNLINLTVCIWFLYFLADKINRSFKEGKSEGFLWMLLLGISIWNYTQLRLTITSASPDFIVAIFILAITYLFIQSRNTLHLTLVILFCLVTNCIKLSSLPIVLLGFYSLFFLIREKKWKSIGLIAVASVLLFSAFMIRNAITSGYLLYPSPFPDLINKDWKIDRETVREQQDYITAYARTQTSFEEKESSKIAAMKLREWLPLWWQKLSLSDKFIIVMVIISLLALSISFKRLKTADTKTKIIFSILLIGILFWFCLAPDIRFASGFIIGLIAVTGKVLVLPALSPQPKKSLLLAISLYTFLILMYTGYRFINFFSFKQLLVPLSIQQSVTRTITCQGIKIKLPAYDDNDQTTDSDCKRFVLRGDKITDGFRAVNGAIQ